jgi:hypothetical protein
MWDNIFGRHEPARERIMRVATLAVLAVLLGGPAGPAQDTKSKDTAAAGRTRTKLLKVKMTVEFKHVQLRDALKELAAQADMAADRPVMWTYGTDIPAAKPVTYSCKDKPLDTVLDELLKGPGLGYVVISDEEDRRDGWVRITTGGERGYAKAKPSEPKAEATDDESVAAERLKFAKGLIDGGKAGQAKPVLLVITKKYPTTKAAAEAKELLGKIDK